MKLIKTTGGSNGAPEKCNTCGNQHFQKSNIAWHCTTCGRYCPTELGFSTLKEHLTRAQNLMKDFKLAINELEHLTTGDIDGQRK